MTDIPDNRGGLRRTVERLIIENRNSLNDPTTNEPYDVKGIADDVVELIQAREQQLLTEILGELPSLEDLENPLQQSWKLGGTDETSYRHGYHHAASESVAVIKQRMVDASDGRSEAASVGGKQVDTSSEEAG